MRRAVAHLESRAGSGRASEISSDCSIGVVQESLHVSHRGRERMPHRDSSLRAPAGATAGCGMVASDDDVAAMLQPLKAMPLDTPCAARWRVIQGKAESIVAWQGLRRPSEAGCRSGWGAWSRLGRWPRRGTAWRILRNGRILRSRRVVRGDREGAARRRERRIRCAFR